MNVQDPRVGADRYAADERADEFLPAFDIRRLQHPREVVKRHQTVPEDRVGVDCGPVDRLQFVEAFTKATFLGGQLPELAVDERSGFGGRAFEHDAGRVIDFRQAGAKRRVLAAGIKPLGGDLLVDVLAQQPLTFARDEGLQASLDRVEKQFLQRVAAQQVLLAGRSALHDPTTTGVVEGLDLRAVFAVLRAVDRPALVVLAAAPAGDQSAKEEW